LVTIPTTVVDALQKERDDALVATKDARREAEEEQLVAAMVENVHDAAQVARLRKELESMVCSLHFLLLVGSGPWAMLAMPSLNALGFCRCKVKGGGSSLDEVASGAWEEAGSLQARLESQDVESGELRVVALWACCALFPHGVCDNMTEVNEHLCAASMCFHEAIEDGVRQGADSALAVVHFRFLGLVDVREVAEGLPKNTNDTNMALLMPHLEEAADTILAIASLDAVFHCPSPDHEG
jgi:hypothetical protein